jgi:hypothetical protein
MKKILMFSLSIIFICLSGVFAEDRLYVYTEANSPKNNFIPSGWMGDLDDIRILFRNFTNPESGENCIRIQYTPKKPSQKGWAGIYWQSTANNWGIENTGMNLSKYKTLVFYAKGEKGCEVINDIKVGGIDGKYTDSANISYKPIILGQRWKKYTIDLRGKNLSRIIGGFAFVLSEETNPAGAVFYLDEIYFE